MRNRYFTVLGPIIFMVLLVACGNTKQQAKNERSTISTKTPNNTNVIWIITDEHNFRTIGAYRNQLTKDQAYLWGKDAYVQTPNLDRLAENGIIFNRMYCSAAVCTPSRASMMTGMYCSLPSWF